ncbi:unnamed protein product [Owenia fusiformis]|uniref:Uncharacterized protein n=1 Tax=Owenia fusiformis TaxID=6347 RepID=A0A8J1TVE5_OWEFU|nr:unnamed protein product [Owenia fusiformis]
MTRLLVPVAIVTLVAIVNGQTVAPLCTPAPTTPSKPAPGFPLNYQAKIEASFKQRNWTFDFDEYYDYTGNRQAVHQRSKFFDNKFIQNYDNSEIFAINYMEGTCNSYNIDKIPEGFQKFLGTKTPDGKFHIFSSSDVLKLVAESQSYKGIANIRGINCDWWQVCKVFGDSGAIMEVDFYYAAKDKWYLPVANPTEQYPVQIHVKGTFVNPIFGTTFNFENSYNFLQFRPLEVGDSMFMTDRGLVCKNRKSVKPVPSLPDAFTFRVEVVDNNKKTVSHVHEWYDNSQGLFRIDYANRQGDGNPIRRIHDFNTGVAYVINKFSGNCTAEPIRPVGLDVETVDDALNVRIRTAKEFFDFEGVNYTYEGMRIVRDVPTDVWIAKRKNWPKIFNTNSTWEWFFTNKDVVVNTGTEFEGVVPWRLEVFSKEFELDIITNFFDFKEGRQEVFEFDISPCYVNLKRQDFQFALKGNPKDLIGPVGLRIFRYLTLISIQGAAVISPIRIANLRFDVDGSEKIIVMFTMLDKAPIKGSVEMKTPELPIEEAAKGLTDYINNGQLSILVPDSTNSDSGVKTVVAEPYSFKQIVRDPGCKNNEQILPQTAAGPSVGVVAGVSAALVILGSVLGIVALWMVCFIKQKPNSIKEVKIVGSPTSTA